MKAHCVVIMLHMITVACCASSAHAMDEKPGELLYNGIRLPAEWPPRIDALTREPMRVPYLESPPSVIPIDVGRQLFVDDFLVETTTLKRTHHRPVFYEGNPILRPEKPWEQTGVVFDHGDPSYGWERRPGSAKHDGKPLLQPDAPSAPGSQVGDDLHTGFRGAAQSRGE